MEKIFSYKGKDYIYFDIKLNKNLFTKEEIEALEFNDTLQFYTRKYNPTLIDYSIENLEFYLLLQSKRLAKIGNFESFLDWVHILSIDHLCTKILSLMLD